MVPLSISVNRFDDVKAQTDSAMDSGNRAIDLTKLLKDNGQRFSRNTHAGVGDIKFSSFSIRALARGNLKAPLSQI
jgi:hypothetical protein